MVIQKSLLLVNLILTTHNNYCLLLAQVKNVLGLLGFLVHCHFNVLQIQLNKDIRKIFRLITYTRFVAIPFAIMLY